MTAQSSGDAEITTLYWNLLDGRNKHSAHDFASLFTVDANVIGFDGSQMNGKQVIETELTQIFTNHQTARYIAKVREVRFLAPEAALLRAVVGIVPPGQMDINPAVNSIQTLVATKHDNLWCIALFQNTPAQFHGRPDLSDALTAELRNLLREC